MTRQILFLEIVEVIKLHDVQINTYGGMHGVRDIRLLESALAMPQISFDGNYLQKDIYDMAGAYLYHIIKNHAFIDGNKRTGIVVTLIFLKINNINVLASQKDIFDLAIKVANSTISKEELGSHIKKLLK